MVDNVNPSQAGGPGYVPSSEPTQQAPQATPAATPEGQQPAPVAEPTADPAPASTTPDGQPVVDNVPSELSEDGTVIYDETGDPALDLALSFIGSLGIEGSDPIMVAAANGDFTLLEAKLGSMGDKAKGWERYVALGKDAHARQLTAFKAEQEKSLNSCYQVAGGKEQWEQLVKWAGSVASDEEKAALNAMFDAGPVQAAMAARALVSAHAEAKGTTIAPANPAAAASGVAPAAPKTLTKADYAKEVNALYQRLGSAMDTSPEYAELRSRYFGR